MRLLLYYDGNSKKHVHLVVEINGLIKIGIVHFLDIDKHGCCLSILVIFTFKHEECIMPRLFWGDSNINFRNSRNVKLSD